jgi:hypothetical protein
MFLYRNVIKTRPGDKMISEKLDLKIKKLYNEFFKLYFEFDNTAINVTLDDYEFIVYSERDHVAGGISIFFNKKRVWQWPEPKINKNLSDKTKAHIAAAQEASRLVKKMPAWMLAGLGSTKDNVTVSDNLILLALEEAVKKAKEIVSSEIAYLREKLNKCEKIVEYNK